MWLDKIVEITYGFCAGSENQRCSVVWFGRGLNGDLDFSRMASSCSFHSSTSEGVPSLKEFDINEIYYDPFPTVGEQAEWDAWRVIAEEGRDAGIATLDNLIVPVANSEYISNFERTLTYYYPELLEPR